MRLRTNLRELRGDRQLVDIERELRAAGHKISRADLSRIERGQQLPTDEQMYALMDVYGWTHDWYPPTVWKAIGVDLHPCPGCGEPLPPSTIGGKRFHGRACRDRARRQVA